MVDDGVFNGLRRGGKPIIKTYGGNEEELMKNVLMPPVKEDLGVILDSNN